MTTNRGYISLFDYLTSERRFPTLYKLRNEIFGQEDYLKTSPFKGKWNSNPHSSQQFLGAVQPFVDMYKDFVATVQPYKSHHYLTMDIIQAPRGIKNIVKGLINLVLSPVIFMINTGRYIYNSINIKDQILETAVGPQKYGDLNLPTSRVIKDSFRFFGHNMKINAKRTLSWLIEGAANVIRGTTQIFTAPFALMRIALRETIGTYEDPPRIEQRQSMQKLVKQGHDALAGKDIQTFNCVTHELHRKFQSSKDKYQPSNITSQAELTLFNIQYNQHEGNPDGPLLMEATQYLGLFSLKRREQQESLDFVRSENTFCF